MKEAPKPLAGSNGDQALFCTEMSSAEVMSSKQQTANGSFGTLASKF